MFSESVQNLINSTSFKSARERISQIEGMVDSYTSSTQVVNPFAQNKTASAEFSDYLKVQPPTNLKYKIVPPIAPTKGYIENLIQQAAKKYNLDEKLLHAIIKKESSYNPNAVSSTGAQGLMQLMPATAKRLGVANAYDPVQNVDAGAKHLKGLLAKYRGNLVLALAAYNAGGGNVAKYGGVPPFKETQNYVKSVLSNYLNPIK